MMPPIAVATIAAAIVHAAWVFCSLGICARSTTDPGSCRARFRRRDGLAGRLRLPLQPSPPASRPGGLAVALACRRALWLQGPPAAAPSLCDRLEGLHRAAYCWGNTAASRSSGRPNFARMRRDFALGGQSSDFLAMSRFALRPRSPATWSTPHRLGFRCESRPLPGPGGADRGEGRCIEAGQTPYVCQNVRFSEMFSPPWASRTQLLRILDPWEAGPSQRGPGPSPKASPSWLPPPRPQVARGFSFLSFSSAP